MSILDIILLICFIPAAVLGYQKGMIKQVISIISIIAGVWLAFQFATLLGNWMQEYITASSEILTLVAFVVIMLGAFIGFGLIGKLIEATFKLVCLGWVNRLLGVAFSIIKTILILSLFIIVFESLNHRFSLVDEATLSSSLLYPIVKDMAYIVFPYIQKLLFWTQA